MLTVITARIKYEPVMYYLFNKRNGETVTQNIYKSNCFNLSETLRKLHIVNSELENQNQYSGHNLLLHTTLCTER